MQSDERLRRIEKATDLPLLLLAVALVPMLLTPLIFKTSASVDAALLAGDWTIWAIFAVDFTIKLAVAPRRWHYVRTHWLEAAMVVLPFLRPLRVLRVLRALRFARIGVAIGLNVTFMKRLASQRGVQLVVAAVVIIGLAGSMLVLVAERSEPTSNIHSFGDALWWAASTMTTVGYGDRFPVTAEGRGVAIALMLFGIATLSTLTATIAAFLVQEHEGGIDDVTLIELRDEVRLLRADLAALSLAPERRPPGDTARPPY